MGTAAPIVAISLRNTAWITLAMALVAAHAERLPLWLTGLAAALPRSCSCIGADSSPAALRRMLLLPQSFNPQTRELGFSPLIPEDVIKHSGCRTRGLSSLQVLRGMSLVLYRDCAGIFIVSN